ncbi:MAG: hypothetical protein SVV67_11155 [Bacillota bacterium]|nr:hypothetical protein [Bacillota bacterium]
MKKLAVLFLVLFLTLSLTACGSANKTDDDSENTGATVIDETESTDSIDNTDNENNDKYVPQKAVPEDLPIYPGAILWSDSTSYGEDNNWQWLYSTTGSGNEIVEFFIKELQNLGFEIDEEYTFANREEFFVTTTDLIVQVYWLDSDNLSEVDAVTADTPNRHYSIVVNLDEWEAR